MNKRIISGAAALAMVLSGAGALPAGTFEGLSLRAFAADIVDSGYCGREDENEGKNVTWALDSEGTLTISGTEISAEITFPERLSSIGADAFFGCLKLKSVIFQSLSFPNSIVSIGQGALGYYLYTEYDGELIINTRKKIEGFTIKGYKGSDAETYANDNGFTFVPIEEVRIVPGDVTGNNKVDGEDLARLQQFVAGWNVTVETDTGDVTGDGKVNGEDIALVQKYLAGWSVTLGRADA